MPSFGGGGGGGSDPVYAHLVKVLRDDQGKLVLGTTVRVLEPDSTTLIAEDMFSDDQGSTTLDNPFICDTGVIDFYLATPKRVRLGVTSSLGGAERYYENIDVIVPEDTGGTFDPSGTGTDSTQISGDTSDDSASNASGTNTVAAGVGANASGDGSVAIGVDSIAAGTDDVVIGHNASAVVTLPGGGGGGATSRNVAVGANAETQADGSTGITDAVAVGEGAVSRGPGGVAVGGSSASLSTVHGGIAVGFESQAAGARSIAIGDDAFAEGDSDVAIGTNARTTVGGTDNTVIGPYATALGTGSGIVPTNRGIAIGYQAVVDTDDHAVIKANVLDLQRSAPSGHGTAIKLYDSTGVAWFITVDPTGHLSTSTTPPA